MTGVVPYVPTPSLPLLQRDTFTFETTLPYDGGPDGLDIIRRVLSESPSFLRRGGAVVLEIGGDQDEALDAGLQRLGYADVEVVDDGDGGALGIEATLR